MLNHVAENTWHYEWDVHLLLAIHGSNLARWSAKMTDPLNKGDEFIYTKTKPWTTVNGSIADLTVAELCMICDMCLIFLGNNNYRILRYKQCIQSPITSPASSGINEKPDTTVESTVMSAGEPVPGTVVGVLNKDLSRGTVVTQSPVSIELEAAKSLLALKNEGDTTNQDNNQQSLNSSLPPTSPALPVTNDSNHYPPPPEVTLNETELPNKGSENLSETVPKENNLTRNVETKAVEMAAVETSPESDPADTSTPRGVIILPLPSCPVTPLNIHPENKKVETGSKTPTSHSDTITYKTDQVETKETKHVEMTTTTKSGQLRPDIVLNKCAVKLTKLSTEDVKRLCGQKPISKSIPKQHLLQLWKPTTEQDQV